MERIEVVARTAVELRTRHQGNGAENHTTQLIERLCESLELDHIAVPASDVMLGGAYSRLQLWEGASYGVIWLRNDLDAETRIFAIAHELGHYALHRGEGISLHSTCDQHEINQQADPADLRTEDHRVEEYTPRARRELEANAFAAELLAPRSHVRRLFAAERDVDATLLAAHFGISRTL
ncbi:MAG TPA: ImmA/IrrE family metallo-endopeptidase, partial [Ktedonobacterales bacterium]